MGQEGGEEAGSENANEREKNADQKPIARCVPGSSLGGQDHSREQKQDQGKPAMEAANLRAQPGVEVAFDLAAVIRVRAIRLAMAGIADMRGRPIQHELPPVVGLSAFEVLPGGAFPGIELWMISESSDVELFRKTVRLAGNPFQNSGYGDKKKRVGRHHQDIGMHAMNHDCRAPDSTTSVKRTPSGSSIAGGGAGWRIPNQAR